MNVYLVKVGMALCVMFTLVSLTSCVSDQTINITGNGNYVGGQSGDGSFIGRDLTYAPGVGDIAKRDATFSGNSSRYSGRPGCEPSNPCCRQDEVYFAQQSELVIRRQRFQEDLCRARRAPVYYNGHYSGNHRTGGRYHQEERRLCPLGSQMVQTGVIHTQVCRDLSGRIIHQKQNWIPSPGSQQSQYGYGGRFGGY